MRGIPARLRIVCRFLGVRDNPLVPIANIASTMARETI
jgi:hypothetical protein